MNPHDESRLAGHRHAFLRHLPRRVEKIGRRLHRFLQDGWDINGLALLHEDALRLGEGCRRHGLDEAGAHFLRLHELLDETLQAQALPDPETGERLWHLVEDIGATVPMGAEVATEVAAPRTAARQSGRYETPPANYWRRWGEDAPPAAAVEEGPAADVPAAPAVAAARPAAAKPASRRRRRRRLRRALCRRLRPRRPRRPRPRLPRRPRAPPHPSPNRRPPRRRCRPPPCWPACASTT